MDSTFFYAVFRFSFFAVFVTLHLVLMLGIILEWRRDKAATLNAEDSEPTVSVIVPVHNEDSRLQGLLQSLKAQDYNRAEIIFVDDRSCDRTPVMLAEFVATCANARVITLTENPGSNHKQYALAQGIQASSGELLLFTDADCQMSPRWIRVMARRMCDKKKTGVVIAPVLKRPGGKGFFHLYQCFEHGIRFVYLAGATGIGAAGGGFGNNLILRRTSLDAVGGYENIPPSPTEDAALISKIRSCSEYKVRSALGADTHVITQGEDGWRSLIHQTLRWNNGGLFSPDAVTRFNYTFLMLSISAGILAFPLLVFVPSIWPLPVGVLLSMTLNTIANISLFRVSLPKLNPAYILALLFTPLYFTFLTALGLAGIKPTWKGKTV